MIVSEAMNRVATISNDITLQHAAKIMSREGIGSLVLMVDNRAVGIITERDIVKNVSKLDKKVSSVMTKKLITIDDEADLEDAAKIMKKNGIKRILVRGPREKIVGIITSTDLIANADLLNQDLEFF